MNYLITLTSFEITKDISAITFCLSLLPRLIQKINYYYALFVNTKSPSSAANEGFEQSSRLSSDEGRLIEECDITFLKL